jgi:hypothetical protein
MSRFTPKWNDEQKDALVHAYEDRGIRPLTRVLDLARAGELQHQGEPLSPFDMPVQTARAHIKAERKRRLGKARSDVASMRHEDAIDTLRVRLLSAADKLLEKYEKQLAGGRVEPDPERLRQITRAVREAASLPAPGQPRPAKPGRGENGKTEGLTRGGVGAGILSEARAQTRLPSPTQEARETDALGDMEQQEQQMPGPLGRVETANTEAL